MQWISQMRVGQNLPVLLDHVDLKFCTYLKHVQPHHYGAQILAQPFHISTHKAQGPKVSTAPFLVRWIMSLSYVSELTQRGSENSGFLMDPGDPVHENPILDGTKPVVLKLAPGDLAWFFSASKTTKIY